MWQLERRLGSSSAAPAYWLRWLGWLREGGDAGAAGALGAVATADAAVLVSAGDVESCGAAVPVGAGACTGAEVVLGSVGTCPGVWRGWPCSWVGLPPRMGEEQRLDDFLRRGCALNALNSASRAAYCWDSASTRPLYCRVAARWRRRLVSRACASRLAAAVVAVVAVGSLAAAAATAAARPPGAARRGMAAWGAIGPLRLWIVAWG